MTQTESWIFYKYFYRNKKLLWDKEKEILEFQNPLSLHITVYYLPWKTTEIENKKNKRYYWKIFSTKNKNIYEKTWIFLR